MPRVALQQSASIPRVRIAGKPVIGLSPTVSHGDRVTFGLNPQKAGEPDIAKSVEREALRLFSNNPTTEALLKALHQKYPDVKIFHGKDHKWVNNVCETYGNMAFFHIPDSVRYGEDPENVPDFDAPAEQPQDEKPVNPIPLWMRALKAGISVVFKNVSDGEERFNGHYTKKILPDLYRNKQMAIFISEHAEPDILMHEVYHLLQAKKGQHFGTNNLAIDSKAKDFNFDYNAQIFKNPFVTSLWQGVLRLQSWLIEVPLILAKKALGIIKPKVNSPGAALREEMYREQEVDKFLIKHGGKLGLNIFKRVGHTIHFVLESKLKEILSYKLD